MQRLLIAHTPFSVWQDGLEKPTRFILVQNWNDQKGESDTYSVHFQTNDGAAFSGIYFSCKVLGEASTRHEAYLTLLSRLMEHNALYRNGSISNIPMGISLCNPPEVL